MVSASRGKKERYIEVVLSYLVKAPRHSLSYKREERKSTHLQKGHCCSMLLGPTWEHPRLPSAYVYLHG